MLCEAALGGLGRHVLDLTRTLAKTGHEVHLVYSSRRADVIFSDGLKQLQDRPGIFFYQLDMTKSPHPSDLDVVIKLRRYMRANGPFDIVHSHSTKAGFIARAGLPFHRRHIYTPHAFLSLNLSLPKLARLVIGFGENLLSKVSYRLIMVSPQEYAHAVELGIKAEKLAVVPNGVDLSRFDSGKTTRAARRSSLGIAPEIVCIGFVGRMTYQKHPQLLVKSIAQLPLSVQSKIHVAVIGDGEYWEEVKALSRDSSVGHLFSWLGGQDAIPWMPAFDFLLMTSRYEGLPIVALEAMGNGLPIITTAVAGTGWSIQHNLNGLVAPLESGPEEMAPLISMLVEDADLRARLSQASLVRSQFFSLEMMTSSTVMVYSGQQPPTLAA